MKETFAGRNLHLRFSGSYMVITNNQPGPWCKETGLKRIETANAKNSSEHFFCKIQWFTSLRVVQTNKVLKLYLLTSKPVFPSFQGSSTIFDNKNFHS